MYVTECVCASAVVTSRQANCNSSASDLEKDIKTVKMVNSIGIFVNVHNLQVLVFYVASQPIPEFHKARPPSFMRSWSTLGTEMIGGE